MTWLELSLWGCNMCTDCSSPWHICVDNSFSRFSNEGLLVRPLKKNCTQPWIRKLFIPFLFSHLSLDFNTSFASNDPKKKKIAQNLWACSITMSSHNPGDLVRLSKSGWKWESLLVVWHEICCYSTVWESVWRFLLLYVYENCMRNSALLYCTVWELYENCCCYVERESVAIVLYCCNTRRELTLKLSNETLSKQAEKEKKKKKRSLPMIPNFQAQKATTTNHTQQQ